MFAFSSNQPNWADRQTIFAYVFGRSDLEVYIYKLYLYIFPFLMEIPVYVPEIDRGSEVLFALRTSICSHFPPYGAPGEQTGGTHRVDSSMVDLNPKA